MTGGFSSLKSRLPKLGIGLGLRRELAGLTFSNSASIDWLEIVPENYMDLGGACRERLEKASRQFPLISHGVNLSIGSTDDLNQEYLQSAKRLFDEFNIAWWSDHLCFSSVDRVYMHDLLPLPFTKEAIAHICERVKRVQDKVERPFLLENISYYMQMPCSEMNETDFISEILERSDCGLLLDVNNVFVNSINHNFDPFAYVDRLPLDRVVQIHVAGHKRIGDYIIDTHGSDVVEPVYKLLEYVLRRTSVQGILLERDQNFPQFSQLLAELDLIRAIAASCGQFEDRQSPKLNSAQTEDSDLSHRQAEEESQQKSRGREVRALSA